MTGPIVDALRVRYAPPEYIFFEQFSLFEGGRRLDGLAVSPWAARNYAIIGFEFKVSRSDWLSELRQPAKAEESAAFCDRWYVVAPKSVIQVEEAPEGWGVIELRGTRLFTIRQAKNRDSVPIDRAFMARCIDKLSRAARAKSGDELQKLRTELYEEISESFKKSQDRKEERASEELKQLREWLKEFEQASGIQIHEYSRDAGKIGAVVAQILSGPRELPDLDYNRTRLVMALEGVEAAITALREVRAAASPKASAAHA